MGDLMNEWIYVLTRSNCVWCESGDCETEALSYTSSSVFKNKIQSTKFDESCKFIYFLSPSFICFGSSTDQRFNIKDFINLLFFKKSFS